MAPTRRELLRNLTVVGAGGLLGTTACARPPALRAVPGKPGEEVLDTEHGEVPLGPLDPQLGHRSARCTIVMFADFLCPFCRDLDAVIMRLHKELPGHFRLVFKHLPLSIHMHARMAAVAAQIVFLEAGTDAFWEFHQRLFAKPADITAGNLALWARQAGVSDAGIERRAGDAEAKVAADVALARKLEVDGAPYSFIDRRAVSGAYPYEQYRAWVLEVR
jgi:protein-disulfide isomerase